MSALLWSSRTTAAAGRLDAAVHLLRGLSMTDASGLMTTGERLSALRVACREVDNAQVDLRDALHLLSDQVP